ncbi:hypothetical protein MNV84_01616 [Leishmania braziliensis]|nr:hypothetical protein MNV84_01616 [Leishmania braziliensis]CAJ2469003.1 unnamed protein product [Leishmania braziliensis]
MPKGRNGGTSSSSGAIKGITKAFSFWQDREIHFGASAAALKLRENTEHVYAAFNHVEDKKGNEGHSGTLLVTNLRLIWSSARRQAVNISIGYYCVQKLTVQEMASKLVGGTTECVTLSAKYGTRRFQFIFLEGNGVGGASQGGSPSSFRRRPSKGTATDQSLYCTIRAVWNAYESTRVYRELRVRSAVVQHGNLLLLDGESVISRTAGVSSVSKDEGRLGTLVVTNIRVVWFAAAELFNVSVPYLQFVGLRSQMSKFGQALVIETSSYAGNFVLGFRIDPEEKLNEMYTEISTLWRTWTTRPLLGMKVALHDNMSTAVVPGALESEGEAPGSDSRHGEDAHRGACSPQSRRQTEGQYVLREAPMEAFAAYYADDGQKGADRRPVYEPSIGLAVEKLRKGATIQSLWDTSVPP